MVEPLVSYVVPTWNRVEWIGECLQGLLMQTVPDIEVVVVDDASTDGTDELLQWFADKDKRVRIITNEKNLGAGRSRNLGNELAKAPIIGVADSDDVYPDNRTQDILTFFEKHKDEPIMMNGPYVRVNYFGQSTEDFLGEEFDEAAFKEKGTVNYFCHPVAAYYRKDILEVGGYKPETKTMTDDAQLVYDWIAAGKKIGFFKENYLCGHRVLPDSIMAKMRGWQPEWAQ